MDTVQERGNTNDENISVFSLMQMH